MRNVLPASVLLVLLMTPWVFAQNSSSSAAPRSAKAGQQSQTTQAPSGQDNETVEGCLTASAGSYTLTDSATGKTYTLTGDIATLNDHVNQEVRLTGSIVESAQRAAGAPAGADAAFKVKKAKTLSSSCATLRR